MNYLVIAFFAFLATASASTSVITPTTKILEGPSSKTTLIGPDGSLISSASTGGQVVIGDHQGEPSAVVATAPQTTSYISSSVPQILTPASDVLVYSAEKYTPIITEYSAPVVSAYGAPILAGGLVAHKSLDTIVAGPSGSISTRKTLAEPIVVSTPNLYAYAVRYY